MKLIPFSLVLLLLSSPVLAEESQPDYRIQRLAQEAVANGWKIASEDDLWRAYAEANGISSDHAVVEEHMIETAKGRREAPSAQQLNVAQEVLRVANGLKTFRYQEQYAYLVGRGTLVICGQAIEIRDGGTVGDWATYKTSFALFGQRMLTTQVELDGDAGTQCNLGVR